MSNMKTRNSKLFVLWKNVSYIKIIWYTKEYSTINFFVNEF